MTPPDFRPRRLPLLLLLIALSTSFLYVVDEGHIYRPGHHAHVSAKNLAIAENLSPDHGFRLFRARHQGSSGSPTYDMYSRFPVGGYALLKLAILPFGNDLSAKILTARILMLLLFSAAAVLAFHSLARITSRPWIALAATLMAFSSYYMLFYGDAVTTEGSVDLFAVMLAFHGMAVFVQEGRFPQLLAKTGVALLLGWHVYAFLLPFILLGLAREALRAWKQGTAFRSRARSAAAAVLRSRYTALGLASLLFGAALLTFNFANEYAAFGGETPVTELPSFQSVLRHMGLDRSFAVEWWVRFLRQQFFRVCVASVPFLLTDRAADMAGWFLHLSPLAPGFLGPGMSGLTLSIYLLALLTVVGAAAALVRLAGPLLPGRQCLLMAALALSGFCWALPMRNNSVHHNHEALFYVGVPLVFYSLLLLYVRERWGARPVIGLAAAALLAFAASTFRMDQRWGLDAHAAETQRTAMAELGAIRETTRGKAVLVLESMNPEWSPEITWAHYYLAGSVLVRFPDMEAAARAADFIVTPDRVESDALLTPRNQQVFLHDSSGIADFVEWYRAAYQQAVSAGDPAARSRFDVYLDDDTLTFVREPCVWGDLVTGWIPGWNPRRIFVDVTLEDPKDLPPQYKWYGSDDPLIQFLLYPVLFEGKCVAVLSLPGYPVSRIWTGQRPGGTRGQRHWVVDMDL